MSTINAAITDNDDRTVTVLWEELGNGDDGAGIAVGNGEKVSVQAKGNFAGSAAVSMEGSNDGGSTWADLPDPYDGSAITLSAAGIASIPNPPGLIRPDINAGNGSTDIDVYLHFAKQG